MKRVMSVLLVAALLVCALSVSAFAYSSADNTLALTSESDVTCEGLPCFEIGEEVIFAITTQDTEPAVPEIGSPKFGAIETYANGVDSGFSVTADTVSYTASVAGKITIAVRFVAAVYDGAIFSLDRTVYEEKTIDIYVVNKVADAADNRIEGITEPTYKRYLDISFTAVGDGMDNTAPVKGDTRYAPAKYSANLDEHKFAEGIYSGTYSHNGTGVKTLVVTFELEQFDGTSWVKTGITDEKEVSYESVSNGSYVELIMAIFVLLDRLLAMITGGSD
ncbi:MAG: hypothetical protein GX051_02375 [Clostridiales bacterium]|nr:hypothetical protein [Clostridiales bacterium]